jgi:FixJ family two-component response regulator
LRFESVEMQRGVFRCFCYLCPRAGHSHPMKAGAVEFLTKPFSDGVLLGAIEQALERSSAQHAFDSEMRAPREHHASLSRREQEVMALVVTGLLNK